ncbi:dTDP-glucose 4,6-dehydratase [Cytobacillus praedii]|uniref:dTDP-glucose 4,6-dehydratase n=1 Tax=Cytobacillus praedii TaxID=1742358 RepID=UPI0007104DCB|nr:dTDP-glucose 4,6-dehydratase [Cytobacillus praedii]MED3573255.1 dTDP-glucose 4,6-dehydratase [Cytobacillus praedii]
MNNHLLITGGAGFIGANFISYLLERSNYYITNVDSLTYASNTEAIKPFEKSSQYRFFHGDIGNEQDLDAIFDQKYAAIINFAAESHVDRSIVDAAPFIRTNINGTFNLLQAVLNGKAMKMIQISTDEVYGSLQSTDPPFTVETPLAPNNPYSATKAGADLLVRSYFKTHQLPLIITRCSNNYGPIQNAEKFIPKVISNALNNIDIPVYGDGLNIRDWIYVEDHCRAIKLVLENGVPGEVYNIGGYEEKTNLEVIQIILNKLKKSDQLIHFIEDRKGHDRRYSMDSGKIASKLGWKPLVSFSEGIDRTIEWYKKQEHDSR